LLAWVHNFQRKPKLIYLNHGEISAARALKYRIETELGLKVIIPKMSESFSL
jgi:metallo-beta-lactamase family protein